MLNNAVKPKKSRTTPTAKQQLAEQLYARPTAQESKSPTIPKGTVSQTKNSLHFNSKDLKEVFAAYIEMIRNVSMPRLRENYIDTDALAYYQQLVKSACKYVEDEDYFASVDFLSVLADLMKMMRNHDKLRQDISIPTKEKLAALGELHFNTQAVKCEAILWYRIILILENQRQSGTALTAAQATLLNETKKKLFSSYDKYTSEQKTSIDYLVQRLFKHNFSEELERIRSELGIDRTLDLEDGDVAYQVGNTVVMSDETSNKVWPKFLLHLQQSVLPKLKVSKDLERIKGNYETLKTMGAQKKECYDSPLFLDLLADLTQLKRGDDALAPALAVPAAGEISKQERAKWLQSEVLIWHQAICKMERFDVLTNDDRAQLTSLRLKIVTTFEQHTKADRSAIVIFTRRTSHVDIKQRIKLFELYNSSDSDYEAFTELLRDEPNYYKDPEFLDQMADVAALKFDKVPCGDLLKPTASLSKDLKMKSWVYNPLLIWYQCLILLENERATLQNLVQQVTRKMVVAFETYNQADQNAICLYIRHVYKKDFRQQLQKYKAPRFLPHYSNTTANKGVATENEIDLSNLKLSETTEKKAKAKLK